MNLIYQVQCKLINLNDLIGHILYQIFKIILEYIKKNHDSMTGHMIAELTDHPPVRIYGNKIENTDTSKIKSGY